MMASYRLYSVLTLSLSMLCLGIGLIIGYFVQVTTDPLLLAKDQHACDVGYGSYLPEVQSFLEKNIIEACAAETCDISLPRTYVVQHLRSETIEIDGIIDDIAWEHVPWSEKFVDLQGRKGHEPILNTRFKLRWDDNNLYMAAIIQDTHVWANRTDHDSDVFNDNAFELLLDTDRSFHNPNCPVGARLLCLFLDCQHGKLVEYKEIGVNAFSTVWDALLTKPYIDGGEALSNWDSRVRVGVHSDGEINNPNNQGDFWSVEMSLPFSQLLAGSVKTDTKPHHMEIWYANLARPENAQRGSYKYGCFNDIFRVNKHCVAPWVSSYMAPGQPMPYEYIWLTETERNPSCWEKIDIPTKITHQKSANLISSTHDARSNVKQETIYNYISISVYIFNPLPLTSIPNIRPKWWSWNPTGAYSLHLPNRWGLIQFRTDSNRSSTILDDQFIPDEYRIAYHTLGVIFEALHKYHALFGSYVNDITQLDLPPYINNRMCTQLPEITLDWRRFVVSVTPNIQLQTIHIRADRFVWFGHIDKLGKNY